MSRTKNSGPLATPSTRFLQLAALSLEGQQAAARNLERCTLRFAKACQRYEERGQPKSEGLPGRYLQPAYLEQMAQAMPHGKLMPGYFHDARWPYQFAAKEAALYDPRGEAVQNAVAQLRHERAVLLVQARHGYRNESKLNANASLLKPFDEVYKAMRREALARAAKPDNVVVLPVAARPQAERLPLRAALLA